MLVKYLPIYYAHYKNSENKIDKNDKNKYILSNLNKEQLRKQGIENLKIGFAKLYKKYNDDIQEIIDKLKEQNINLTRDEVDHII